MTESGIGAVRRSLARQLREARLKSGVTYQHMKDARLAAKSSWARYENGQVRPSVATVRYACEVFKVPPEKRDLLVSLAEQADEPTWWEQKGRGLPTTPGFVMYLEMESFASQIQVFSPLAVPGLIQSPGYQHEQFAVTPGLTTSTAARLAEVRTTRQTETIGRARLSFIIGEEVLSRQVGGTDGMREQVEFMRALAERETWRFGCCPSPLARIQAGGVSSICSRSRTALTSRRSSTLRGTSRVSTALTRR